MIIGKIRFIVVLISMKDLKHYNRPLLMIYIYEESWRMYREGIDAFRFFFKKQ